MSSILRALKKLEGSPDAPSAITVGPGSVSSTHVQKKSFVLSAIFMVVVFLGVAAGVVFISQHKTHVQPTLPAPEVKAQAPPDVSEMKTPAQKPVIKMEANSGLAAPQENENPSVPEKLSPAPEVSGQAGIKENGVPRLIQPQITETEKGVQTAEKPPAAAQSVKNIPENKNAAQPWNSEAIAELSDSAGLDLQAISWAQDISKRLAVINGRLCRENESIGGYTIKQINPDDVIVSNGSTTGKLVLKIR